VILACILGYVACAIAAGYVSTIAGIEDGDEPNRFVLIVFGPIGLMICLAYAMAEVGERRRVLAEARHRLALAELEQQEREIAKLLGGEVRR